MSILLSILIPSTYDRDQMLQSLVSDLNNQISACNAINKVEIKVNVDGGELTIGMKRNLMLLNSKGEYVTFIDSDDEVADTYISDILEAIESKPDVVGMLGYMSTNGTKIEHFKISKDLPYETIKDDQGNNYYLRYNNHLSAIKREIALQIMFPDTRFAEDFDYAKRLKESRLIKTETFIPKELYHYKYISNKKYV